MPRMSKAVRRKSLGTAEAGVPVRQDFATWPEWRAAVDGYYTDHGTLDDWVASLDVLPETLGDWIEYEVDNHRHWWAKQPLLTGEPSAEDLARVRARAIARYTP